MRKNIYALLLLACGMAACATNHQPAPPPASASASPPVTVVTPGPDDPYKIVPVTAAQVAQLRARLDQLQAGMAREKVLSIIDLDSFHIHAFETANSSGITYHFASGHTLELSLQPGDYEATLRWARFDGEMWPKEKEGVRKPLGTLDYDFSSPHDAASK